MKTFGEMIGPDASKPWKLWHSWGKQRAGKRDIGKFRCGPGGINCPCCTPMHPAKIKTEQNRYERRKMRQLLANKLSR